MSHTTHANSLGPLNPVSDQDASALISVAVRERLAAAIVAEPVDHTERNDQRKQRKRTARRRRWPLMLSGAVGVAMLVAAAIAVTASGVLSTGGAIGPPAAQAKILARVAAVLERKPGTIVIERQRFEALNPAGTRPRHTVFVTYIATEVSRGQEHRLTVAGGVQELTAGSRLEIYDKRGNTIYATTTRAWLAAVRAQLPSGAGLATVISIQRFAPGRRSVPEQQLRHHLYRIVGRTTVEGKPALRLDPRHMTVRVSARATQTYPTLYVSPKTYEPIREVFPAQPGQGAGSVVDWLEYRVLPATRANRRLVSLRALHPGARVVNSATGFIRAQARR